MSIRTFNPEVNFPITKEEFNKLQQTFFKMEHYAKLINLFFCSNDTDNWSIFIEENGEDFHFICSNQKDKTRICGKINLSTEMVELETDNTISIPLSIIDTGD